MSKAVLGAVYRHGQLVRYCDFQRRRAPVTGLAVGTEGKRHTRNPGNDSVIRFSCHYYKTEPAVRADARKFISSEEKKGGVSCR